MFLLIRKAQQTLDGLRMVARYSDRVQQNILRLYFQPQLHKCLFSHHLERFCMHGPTAAAHRVFACGYPQSPLLASTPYRYQVSPKVLLF